jgi:hypothetical protein
MVMNFKRITNTFTINLLRIIPLSLGILLIYYFLVCPRLPFTSKQFSFILWGKKQEKDIQIGNEYRLSSNVHIVDSSTPTNPNLTCVKTKTLLHYIWRVAQKFWLDLNNTFFYSETRCYKFYSRVKPCSKTRSTRGLLINPASSHSKKVIGWETFFAKLEHLP